MNKVHFNTKGLNKLERGLNKATKDYKPIFKNAMFKATKRVEKEAIRKAPRGVSSPGIKGSISSIYSWNKGIVGVLKGKADHARFVEEGSRPHFPPVKAVTGREEMLDKWARIKLGAPNPTTAAFLIAKKIARVGTKANPFLTPAFKDNQRHIKEYFKQALLEIKRTIKHG